EQLRPTAENQTPRGERRHQLLHLRHIEALEISDVCERLIISRAYYFRLYQEALDPLAVLVAAALQHAVHAAPVEQPAPQAAPVAPVPAAVEPVEQLDEGALLNRTPLVGRSEELGVLMAHMRAAAAGTGRIVLVGGEPGVGKTRLVEEVARRSEQEGAQFLEGHYLREGGAPYQPWIEGLRPALARLSDAELAELAALYGADLAEVFPELTAALLRQGQTQTPAAAPPDQRQQRLYDGIAGLLRHLSQRAPVLLLLDDLQWTPTLSLVLHVVRQIETMRVLIIGVFRAQEMEDQRSLARDRDTLRRMRQTVTLSLQPLSPMETQQIAEHFFGAVPAGLLGDALYQRTGGNAFYVEEVLRSLAQAGKVQHSAAGWELAGFGPIRIPESIKRLVEERIERLGRPTGQLLTPAAVLGQEFSVAVLCEMGGLTEDEMADLLGQAEAAHLVTDITKAGEERMAFADDQIQEVLYTGLSAMQRRRLHRRAGEIIEARSAGRPEAHVYELARHFTLGAVPDKGAAYSFQAAVVSDRLFAWTRSVPHYQTALAFWEQLGGHLAERASALERLADACYGAAMDVRQALGYVQQAEQLYQELGDRRKQAVVLAGLGREYAYSINLSILHLPTAVGYFMRSHDILAEVAPEGRAFGYSMAGLGLAYAEGLNLRASVEMSNQGRDVGLRIGATSLVVLSNAFVIEALSLLGDIDRCWELATEGRRLSAGRVSPVDRLSVHTTATEMAILLKDANAANEWAAPAWTAQKDHWHINLESAASSAAALSGDMERASIKAREVQARLRDDGQPEFGKSPGLLGLHLVRMGAWDQAEPLLVDGIAWARQSGMAYRTVQATHRLGELYYEQGRYTEAEEQLEWTLDQARSVGARLIELTLLPTSSAAAAAVGKLDQADRRLREAYAILELRQNWCGLAGDVALAEALLRGAQGRDAEADAAFQRTIANYQHYGLPWDEAAALDRWGRMLLTRNGGRGPDRERAQALIAQARRMWEAMGAGQFAGRRSR
ncbi:MAG: AAA family ATPase, partial [Chloroflexi bacterium]|nr:AAA family ATPase [Chloroflexota bacterium]